MNNTKKYINLINENKNIFTEEYALIDFIEQYLSNEEELSDIEESISEFADNNLSIYNSDLIEDWKNNPDAEGKTQEIVGEYNGQNTILEMIKSDLFFLAQENLMSDFKQLKELAKE